jgi:hypothetical protein
MSEQYAGYSVSVQFKEREFNNTHIVGWVEARETQHPRVWGFWSVGLVECWISQPNLRGLSV